MKLEEYTIRELHKKTYLSKSEMQKDKCKDLMMSSKIWEEEKMSLGPKFNP